MTSAIRTRTQDGQFRRIRSDAHIGNVATLKQQAPGIIDRLGAKFTVGELRTAFNGLDVGEIAALPKHMQALFTERHLQRMGVDNNAAGAAIKSALFGSLGDRITNGQSYNVRINGENYDRAILKAFVKATSGNDRITSAKEMRADVVPAFTDGGQVTTKEVETLMFALRHFPTTGKAVRDSLVPALRDHTGAPVRQLPSGEVGFDFMEIYDHLLATGRTGDMYAAKADMTNAEVINMWDNGITLEDFNAHLKSALTGGKSEEALTGKFGQDAMNEVKCWLASSRQDATLARLEQGEVSVGEFQNLVYGSWQFPGTPYDANYVPKYEAVPTKLRDSELDAGC